MYVCNCEYLWIDDDISLTVVHEEMIVVCSYIYIYNAINYGNTYHIDGAWIQTDMSKYSTNKKNSHILAIHW